VAHPIYYGSRFEEVTHPPQIAKDAGLGRESLYKTLSPGAHPRFETINSILHALGVKFAVVAERES
jgi:probable addiction module antidote protein